MQIKEHTTKVKYLFTSPLYIDDDMNVSINTNEYDRFRILLDEHKITDYEQTKIVDGKNEIVISIAIKDKDITPAFEYDVINLMMKNIK